MTDVFEILLSCFVQIFSVILAYQYLVCREEEKNDVKKLLKFKYEFRPFIAMLVSFFVSVTVLLYGFLLKDDEIVRSFMNAEVAIWLSLLAYIDYREKIIPNCLIVTGLLFWVVITLLKIFYEKTPWINWFAFCGIGGLICGGVLLIISLVVKSALGMGDVKMFFVLGLLYGLIDAYGILLFSVIAMGIFSIILLIAKKLTMKSTIPMAPFVILGFLFSILAGM